MAQPLAPHGGNDDVYTPPALAQRILDHYKVSGRVIDPCRGKGAFWREGWDWCEIKEGRDFLDWSGNWWPPAVARHYDWCVTNPPWSKLRPFLQRAMQVSDNVVFLCLVNAFWMKARLRDMAQAGFAIREIALVETPPKPWPQTGFALGAVHVQRGYVGDIKVGNLSL